ncbi:hypothetical protein NL108_012382 [Boleophthalmus pectinirostris]|uniref:uncharacterized protein LOC110166865 n=1 Tax=Boleophthalmus pectinirostris TaxID=150288 RepID=UPI000A1C4C37|nr:uncharacterized protein LOC110166865 [Boleophthalmus pectinirostris]KAJ0069740.1 hypothetical protein NL108_012382 [Boleophthalmus pectinirostris]
MGDVPIDLIVSLATTVVKMAMNVKTNKERCERVAKRVIALQELVLKLKERDPRRISEVVRNALNELSATLVNARDTMRKYQQQTNIVKTFVLSSAHEDKFLKINERLDDTFQVLSGALQIEHGEVLNQVLNAVAGKNNEITQPKQPFPIGFSNMCGPSHQPSPTFQIPTQNITPTVPSVVPTSSTSPIPTQNPPKIPTITVTGALNPPYPPAQRPTYNPNSLSVPTIHVSVPCSMPPRVVTVPPPSPVHPIITMQSVYGTLPAGSIVTRTAPPMVYANAMAPPQMIVTMPPPRPVLTNPGLVTVVMTRPV